MTGNSCGHGHDKTAKTCHRGFNYCFWAKLLVAIPTLPLVALAAAAQFSHPLAQVLAGGGAVFVVVAGAVIIDRLPVFSGMIVKRKLK